MSETFEIHEVVEPLQEEWEELAARVRADPFARPGWIAAWHRSFGGGNLEVHVLRRGGRMVALAPFVRNRRLLSSPTNWHTPSYEILAEDRDSASGLIRESIEHMPPRLLIRFASADGITTRAVRKAAAERGTPVSERELERSPVILLEGDFESYRRGLSKNMRKNLTRRRSRMEEIGEVELAIIDGDRDLESGLQVALAIEASGWKGREETAIASEPRTRAFYSEVTRWAADVGILRLVLLQVGGTPFAFDLGLACGGTYYSLKTGYEARHHRLGPGAALTLELIRHCYDEGLERLALLGSEDDFKRHWAGGLTVDLIELQAFKGPLAPLDRLVQVTGRSLARNLVGRVRSATGG